MSPAERLVALGTATLGEAAPAARILPSGLRPLAPSMKLAGPARTVRCRPGDNLALHLAIAKAFPGEVLVADYGGSFESGPFGEIMALACQLRGVAGLVIDGTVRDSEQIAALGLPVFARGVNIRGTTKLDRGEIGTTVTICGTPVAPGDVVVADADAVIVIPGGEVDRALSAAEARAAREAESMRRLRDGESTLDILGLKEEDAP